MCPSHVSVHAPAHALLLIAPSHSLSLSFRAVQNITYELALMKAGKGKVAGVSGLDDGPPPSSGSAVDEEG